MTINEVDEVKGFVGTVRRYCAWAEAPAEQQTEDLTIAQRLLAELHLSVLGLPTLDCGDDVDDEVSHDEWKIVLQRFQGLPVDLYWDVFDPLEEDAPGLNSLADDLADIYRDLKDGLVLYEGGKHLRAVWEWRFRFQIHWGAHLTGAQRAIHSYLSNY